MNTKRLDLHLANVLAFCVASARLPRRPRRRRLEPQSPAGSRRNSRAPKPRPLWRAAPTASADRRQPAAEAATAAPPPDNEFQDYGVNPEPTPRYDHLSTFALDVDTASYTA